MQNLNDTPANFARALPTTETPIVLFRSAGTLVSVNEPWAQLAADISSLTAYDRHEAMFIGVCPETGALFIAAVHDTTRGRALGGVREASYESVSSAIIDGLRLSQGMTLKSAMAGIRFGGGKGIICLPPDARREDGAWRRRLYGSWGRFIVRLGGYYVTAEDVGNTTEDMRLVLQNCRFVSCLPEDVGGGGNPSPYTARGVLLGMAACCKFSFGSGDLAGRRVHLEGAGNVAGHLADLLVEAGARLAVCDIRPEASKALAARHPEIEVMPTGEAFYSASCDIFAPCARGGSINERTIRMLRSPIVCGAANNQLEDPKTDARRLADRGILYAPDYVVNRGGVISGGQELEFIDEPNVLSLVDRVYPDLLAIFDKMRAGSLPTEAAEDLARRRAAEPHPLYGHLGSRKLAEFELRRMRPLTNGADATSANAAKHLPLAYGALVHESSQLAAPGSAS